MSHVRQQIRERFVTLCTGLTLTGSNVFKSKVYVHDDAHLPSLNIYSGPEALSDEGSETLARRQTRAGVIYIEHRFKADGSDTVDDLCDSSCYSVEVAIAADPTLAIGLRWCELTETSGIFLSDEAEVEYGMIVQTWEYKFDVDATDPDTILNS